MFQKYGYHAQGNLGQARWATPANLHICYWMFSPCTSVYIASNVGAIKCPLVCLWSAMIELVAGAGDLLCFNNFHFHA